MKYVIFGAGNYGKTAYKDLQDAYDIKYFCDNSKEKQGTYFCGLEVISPQEINGKTVIIASEFHLEIALQLISMGIKKFFVALGYEKKKVEAKELDFTRFNDFNIDFNKICAINENNSGSNTLAVKKLAACDLFNIVCVNEKKIDEYYYYNIFTSGTILRTHEGSNLPGRNNIQLWHGFPMKGLGYMSKIHSSFEETVHHYWNKLTAIFSYSTMYNVLIGSFYGIPENKFQITGMPRNDFIFKSNGRDNLGKIFKDKNIENKKIIFYAPTYREDVFGVKNGSKNAYLYTMRDMDLLEFDDFLEQNNSMLIMKLHPRDIETFNENLSGLMLRNFRLLKDEDLYDYELDLYEMLNAFDLLITDYSSIYFDYLLLDRPIIFLPIDLEDYSKTKGTVLEPYDLWTPGEKAIDYKGFKDVLVRFFNGQDLYAAERNRIKRLVHKYTDGNSTGRVLKKIAELTGGGG